MKQYLPVGFATALTAALLPASVYAQVSIRAPFVRVQVGGPGVYVRAPFVNLYVPNTRYYYPPAGVIIQPPPPAVFVPPPPTMLPADAEPLKPANGKPANGQNAKGQPAKTPPPPKPLPDDDQAPPQPVQPGQAMSIQQFVQTFQPKAGSYEVSLLNPLTNTATTVRFSLPEGQPRGVHLRSNEIEFDYGIRRFVRINFDQDGAIVTSR